MPDFNYTTELRAVETASNNLDAADKAYSDALTTYNLMKDSLTDQDTLDKLSDAEKAMTEAYNTLISVQSSYDSAYQNLNAKVVDWQNRVNQLSSLTPIDPTTPAPDQTQQGQEPGAEGQNNVDQSTSGNTAEEVPAGQGGVQNQQAAAQGLANTGRRSGGIVLLADVEDITLMGSYQPGETTPNDVKDMSTAQQWLKAAQADLTAFSTSNGATLENAKSAYDSAKAKYDALLKYNEQVNYQLVPYKEALDKATADMEAAEDAYEDACNNLYFTQSQNGKTLTSASIDLQQQAEKIKLAQEKVKQLSGDAGDEITANVNGVVTAINVSAGDTVTKDTVVCTIEVPDMGHTLSFSVTNDQAQRLRVGDTATVSNYYWGNEIVATLSNIRIDPKNPQTNKELTFELSGDVTSGSELTISVGQKSANYDTIVPNSAIRSDNNGKFVLAIEAKSSPLGNRYIAKRVSVEVLASDDNNSAVVADLSYGDYVITTSNSPVKSGDQVRMAENNA